MIFWASWRLEMVISERQYAASLIKRNRPAFVEIEVAGKSFPRKQIFFPKKSKVNPVFHLPKSAKKLDGEESEP